MPQAPLALVTGASSGIGRETALLLARKGWRVMACARRRRRLEELAAGQDGIEAHPLDLADAAALEEFCARLAEADPPVELLINNAGYSVRGVVEKVPLEAVRRMFEVNFFALCRLTQAVLPGMRRLHRGTVVNVSSIAGKMVFPANGYYSASKHALEAVTDALRHEVAPFGIKVIAIRPGPIATEFGQVVRQTSGPWLEDPDYQPVYDKALGFLQRVTGAQEVPGPEVVARLILEVIDDPHPLPSYAVGPLTQDYLPRRLQGPEDKWRDFLDRELGLKELGL